MSNRGRHDGLDCVRNDVHVSTVLSSLCVHVSNMSVPQIRPAHASSTCSAFIASGASERGQAVSSLGSTLAIKMLSATPVEDASRGVYRYVRMSSTCLLLSGWNLNAP